jgi:hypothetical protein
VRVTAIADSSGRFKVGEPFGLLRDADFGRPPDTMLHPRQGAFVAGYDRTSDCQWAACPQTEAWGRG